MSNNHRKYPDPHDYLAALEKAGLLLTVDRQIDKDAEMHPLVRWQYVGGIEQDERKAFLFTGVVDGKGRRYKFPAVAGDYLENGKISATQKRKGVKPETGFRPDDEA